MLDIVRLPTSMEYLDSGVAFFSNGFGGLDHNDVND
jgi:hypothetical protein